jgi:hypothetical protein
MNRQNFANQYYQDFGEYPDEDIIDQYCGHEDDREVKHYSSTNPGYSKYSNSNPSSSSLESTSDDLLSEINGIFKGIARSARGSIKAHSSSEGKPTYGTEFAFMALIFLSKAMLYFLVKDSHQKGYDFSNM